MSTTDNSDGNDFTDFGEDAIGDGRHVADTNSGGQEVDSNDMDEFDAENDACNGSQHTARSEFFVEDEDDRYNDELAAGYEDSDEDESVHIQRSKRTRHLGPTTRQSLYDLDDQSSALGSSPRSPRSFTSGNEDMEDAQPHAFRFAEGHPDMQTAQQRRGGHDGSGAAISGADQSRVQQASNRIPPEFKLKTTGNSMWHTPVECLTKMKYGENTMAHGLQPSNALVFQIPSSAFCQGVTSLGNLQLVANGNVDGMAGEKRNFHIKALAMLQGLFLNANQEPTLQNGTHLHEPNQEAGEPYKYICQHPGGAEYAGQGIPMVSHAIEYVVGNEPNVDMDKQKVVGVRIWFFNMDPTFSFGKSMANAMSQNELQRRQTASYSQRKSKEAQQNASVNQYISKMYRNVSSPEEFAALCTTYGVATDFASKFTQLPRGKVFFYKDLADREGPLCPDTLFDPLQNPHALKAGLVDETYSIQAVTNPIQSGLGNYFPRKDDATAGAGRNCFCVHPLIEKAGLFFFLDPLYTNLYNVKLPRAVGTTDTSLVQAFLDTYASFDPQLAKLATDDPIAQRCFNSFVAGVGFRVVENQTSVDSIPALNHQLTASNRVVQDEFVGRGELKANGIIECRKPMDRLRRCNQRISTMISDWKILMDKGVDANFERELKQVRDEKESAKEERRVWAMVEAATKRRCDAEASGVEFCSRDFDRLMARTKSRRFVSKDPASAKSRYDVSKARLDEIETAVGREKYKNEKSRQRLIEQHNLHALKLVDEMLQTDVLDLPGGLITRLTAGKKFVSSLPNMSAIVANSRGGIATEDLSYFGQFVHLHTTWYNGIMQGDQDPSHWFMALLTASNSAWRQSKAALMICGEAGVGKSYLIELLTRTLPAGVIVSAGSASTTAKKNGRSPLDGACEYYDEPPPVFAGDRKAGDSLLEETKERMSNQKNIHERTESITLENGQTAFRTNYIETPHTGSMIVNMNTGCMAGFGNEGAKMALLDRLQCITVRRREGTSGVPQWEMLMNTVPGKAAHKQISVIDYLTTLSQVVINCTPSFEVDLNNAEEMMSRADWSLYTQFGDSRPNNRQCAARRMNLMTLTVWHAVYCLFCMPEFANSIDELRPFERGGILLYPEFNILQLMHLRKLLHPTPEIIFFAFSLDVSNRIDTASVVHHVTMGIARMMNLRPEMLYKRPQFPADPNCKHYVSALDRLDTESNLYYANSWLEQNEVTYEEALACVDILNEEILALADEECLLNLSLDDRYTRGSSSYRSLCDQCEARVVVVNDYEKRKLGRDYLDRQIALEKNAFNRHYGLEPRAPMERVAADDESVTDDMHCTYDVERRLNVLDEMETRRLAQLDHVRTFQSNGPVSGVPIAIAILPTYEELCMLYKESTVRDCAYATTHKQAELRQGIAFLQEKVSVEKGDTLVNPMWLTAPHMTTSLDHLAQKLSNGDYLSERRLGKDVILGVLRSMMQMRTETRDSTPYKDESCSTCNDEQASAIRDQFGNSVVEAGEMPAQDIRNSFSARPREPPTNQTREVLLNNYGNLQKLTDVAAARNDFPAHTFSLGNCGDKKSQPVLIKQDNGIDSSKFAICHVYLARELGLHIEAQIACAGMPQIYSPPFPRDATQTPAVPGDVHTPLPDFYNLVIYYKMMKVVEDVAYMHSQGRAFVTPFATPSDFTRLLGISRIRDISEPMALYKQMMANNMRGRKRNFDARDIAMLTGGVRDEAEAKRLDSLVSTTLFYNDDADERANSSDTMANDPWTRHLMDVYRKKGLIDDGTSDTPANVEAIGAIREAYLCEIASTRMRELDGDNGGTSLSVGSDNVHPLRHGSVVSHSRPSNSRQSQEFRKSQQLIQAAGRRQAYM